MLLVCNVISQDHVIILSCDFMGETPTPMVSHTPAKFSSNRHHGTGDIMILICHISQDHVTKRSIKIMGRSPSRLVTILPSLVAMSTVVVEL